MRRCDFAIGLLLASATGVRAQERAKQHRIAIITPAGRRGSLTSLARSSTENPARSWPSPTRRASGPRDDRHNTGRLAHSTASAPTPRPSDGRRSPHPSLSARRKAAGKV